MDMVGRLNDEKKIEVGGVGTSANFKTLIENIAKHSEIKIKTSESGIGPSDHTSFYLKNIPVLFFFTGQHADYHKPTDDADKINYEGEAMVISLIEQTLDSLNNYGKLSFIKTKDADNKETPKFKVTLGIMPDYMYDGKGVRADGVTDGKPAANAGLQAGDIIIKLGEMEVIEMQSYMKALAQFKKGDETIVVIKRKEEVKEMKIKF
jgi:C-terminal processing protease CtpA/Prc